MHLTRQQADRAAGVLVGAAAGDALGVPYEFGPAIPDIATPVMKGGGLGPYKPGEYSDDTQMAWCIAQAAASGRDLRKPDGLDSIAEAFLTWQATGASDIGAQTSAVLSATRRHMNDTQDGPRRQRPRRLTAMPGTVRVMQWTRRWARRQAAMPGTAQVMAREAARLHEQTGRTAGNGSLMRTGPVALAYLNDPSGCADAARKVSSLTHHDPVAGDACVLWCEAIRKAVLCGVTVLEDGLPLIPAERREQWAAYLADTVGKRPSDFNPNGYVVPALQAAACAVRRYQEADDTPGRFRDALCDAVRCGWDTDTVGAIAGALLGGLAGALAIPAEWTSVIHGWPGCRTTALAGLAREIAKQS